MTFFLVVILFLWCWYLTSRIGTLEQKLLSKKKKDVAKTVPHYEAVKQVQEDKEDKERMDQYERKMAREQQLVHAPLPSVVAKTSMASRKAQKELEVKFGGKVFTGIGVVAVFMGVSFFLRYAFENNLISEMMLIVLGLSVGVVLQGLGMWISQKYKGYGHTLVGLGLGLCYLSLYAGFQVYHVISQPLAFALMIVVTAAGSIISVRQNSLPLAIVAQLGGFLTPLLLGTEENKPHTLFAYIALLNVGMVGIAWYKNWQILTWLSVIGTILIHGGWFNTMYGPSQWMVAQAYATLFFILFVMATLARALRHRAPLDIPSLWLHVILASWYFGISYTIINPLYHSFMGLFTLCVALVYGGIGVVLRTQNKTDLVAPHVFFGTSFILLMIVAPIQFEGAWIALSWIALASSLVWMSVPLRSVWLRVIAHTAFILGVVRLVVFDSAVAATTLTPFLNIRMLVLLLAIVCGTMAYMRIRAYRAEIGESYGVESSVFLLQAYGLILFASTTELQHFFSMPWVFIALGPLSSVAALVGMKLQNNALRIAAYSTWLVVTFRLLAHQSLFAPPITTAIINMRVLTFACMILSAAAGLLLIRLAKNIPVQEIKIVVSSASLGIFSLVLMVLTAEINAFSTLPVLLMSWAVVALLAALAGMKWGDMFLRLASYGTLAVVAVRLLDHMTLIKPQVMPFFNMRMLAFIVFLGCVGTVWYALPKAHLVSLPERKNVKNIAMSMLHLWFLFVLSIEVLFLMERMWGNAPKLSNIKNVALSITWMLYAIVGTVGGIVKRSAVTRVGALTLFSVVILKVFLYDVQALNNLYRFISFIILGILLLVVGYLYTKYREPIMRFVKAEE